MPLIRLRRLARHIVSTLVLVAHGAGSAFAQQAPAARAVATDDRLGGLDAAVQALATRVSESVVQLLVTGYGPLQEAGSANTDAVIGPQRSIGSGVVIDAEGYIITNAHVIAGAKRVQAVLHTVGAAGGIGALSSDVGRTVIAKVVGTAPEIDLALLQVDATGLKPVPLADYNAVRQGQLVFAFGSPEGLRNSVSMGVVSAVVRQPNPDLPAIYVQTDAPINPGNSGGPLVNLAGEMVGLNTFIVSKSGGSQGLGFAIPSAVVASAYRQLRKYGHLHRGVLGVGLQAVTPTLAASLRLSRASGVLVSDVRPDTGAERAGVHIGDIITAVNGRIVDNVPMFSLELGLVEDGRMVELGLLRGTTSLTLQVPVTFTENPLDDVARLAADPETNGVPVLGIVGLDVSTVPALSASLRINTGVLVTARTPASTGNVVPLRVGDVIHAVDGIPVRSLDGLRVLLEGHPSNSDVVLQVERDGQLTFVACEIN